MPWYIYLAYFFGGAFLANAIPHLVNGISGQPFPTPFATPPGRGRSSPLLNVFWSAFNVAVGYVLVCQLGQFHIRSVPDFLALGAGGVIMSALMARTFGRRLHPPQ